MMKRILSLVCMMAVLLCACVSVSCAETTVEDGLAWYMAQYNVPLSEDVIQRMEAFSAVEVDCGVAQVRLTEVLYDGCWLYTAATVQPVTPADTLLMPGSAQMNAPVSGGYQENAAGDTRTFAEVAQQDGKTLYAIYVYPLMFDSYDFYFIDHRQGADGQFTLYSGAPVMDEDPFESIDLSIQIYAIDPATSRYTLYTDQSVNVPVAMIGESSTATYRYEGGQGVAMPFDTLTLTQTPLATYASAQWHSEDACDNFQFELVDAEGNTLQPGAPADLNAYSMETLPATLAVKLTSFENGTDTIVTFTMDTAENP